MTTERHETVIVGGGQAGLATAYHLRRRGRQCLVLDEGARVGDCWRTRWDSLRLFTPARYSRLPGMRFPAPLHSFPSKDDMGDYLEAYARRFELPVRTGVRVTGLSHDGDRFLVAAGDDAYEAENVVVATGAHRIPKVPAFADELDPRIVQLHSSAYRNPGQLADGPALVVGVGNSGAEIAYELAASRPCTLAGREAGQIPVRHGRAAAMFVFPVVRFLGQHVITLGTPVGRRLGPKLIAKADPLVRRRGRDLAAAGIERAPRVVGVRDGLPLLEDGRTVDVPNVVWCTGFRNDFGWIDLPVLDEDGEPRHDRGAVASAPGLYFVGLVFQYSLSSDVLPSRGRDADVVAAHIAGRARRRLLVWNGTVAEVGGEPAEAQ